MLNLQISKNKKQNGTIYSLTKKTSILDIKEAFCFGDQITGKILFNLISYDANKEKGHRISENVDFYLDSYDASYLSYMLKTGKIRKLCKENQYGKGFEQIGGGTKNGKLICKKMIFQLDRNDNLYLKILAGDGKKTQTGGITPCFTDMNAPKSISIKLEENEMITMGLSIERGIRYFDIWNAMGVVKERCSEFHEKKADNMSTDFPEVVSYPTFISAADLY